MIRKLLATTAFATVVATGAFAQENNAAPAATNDATGTMAPAQNNAGGQMQPMSGYLASNLIGETVYTSAAVEAAEEAAEGEVATTTAEGQATQEAQPAPAGEVAQTDPAAQTTTEQPAATTAQNTEMAAESGEMPAPTGTTTQTGENIGEVNDVVINQSGQVEAIVVGVGGFLGIGEKNVALPFGELQWAQDGGGDPWIVVNQTKESLEALPEFDRAMYEPSANTAMNATGTTNGGMAPATGTTATTADGTVVENNAATTEAPATQETVATAPAAPEPATEDTMAAAPATTEAPATQDTMAAAPATTEAPAAQDNAAATGTGTTNTTDQTQTAAIDRSTLQEIAQDQLTAENLVGTTVYGANDENIGEIGDIVLTQDGQVDAVLVDVGGFLGIGEKRVAVGMDKLQFLQDGNGNRYLYTNFSEEQLNAQAAYDEGTYSQSRDQQRLIVQ